MNIVPIGKFNSGKLMRLKPKAVFFKHVGMNRARDCTTPYFVKVGTLELQGAGFEMYKSWCENSGGCLAEVLQQEDEIIVIYQPVAHAVWLDYKPEFRFEYHEREDVIVNYLSYLAPLEEKCFLAVLPKASTPEDPIVVDNQDTKVDSSQERDVIDLQSPVRKKRKLSKLVISKKK